MNVDDETVEATEDRYVVPGLARGLRLLQAFTPERPQMTLGELAGILCVTKSSVFRVAYTLAQMGFLRHDQNARSYSLGPAVLSLGYGYLAGRDLIEIARPELERLRDQTGWSAHLGILDGREVVYLMRVPAHTGLISIVHVGSRLPAHATTMGRVLLSGLSLQGLSALYKGTKIARVKQSTPARLSVLVAQWNADRERPVVTQVGEFEDGVVSVAAAVRDAAGRIVGAINLSTVALKEGGRTIDADVVDRLKGASNAISMSLGYR